MSARTVILTEAKTLLRVWATGTFPTRAESIRYHAHKHGGGDVWTYLRRAYAFRKRGARRRTREGGEIIYRRSSGEFLIEQSGKIISYGANRQ